jgi:glutamate dehydrogenase (NAD(P)+)
VDATGSVVGFSGAEALEESLLELDVDVLVPAAVEGVLTAENAPRVKARIVVEGANGPTSPEADMILEANDVLVVPDILANAGGVVVSYFEWAQANQTYWWSEAEVERRLAERMLTTWEQVNSYAGTRRLSLRSAAMAMAVERVVTAHGLRGLYP